MHLGNLGGKVIGVAAMLLLVAACATKPDESAEATGGGGQTSTTQPAVQAAPEPSTTMQQDTGPRPGSAEDFVLNVGDRVFFAFDKYNLTPEARRTLERQAAWLQRFPSVTATIEGHCDERGTREYNLALGERRANAAKAYLVALGVDANRLSTISYGKERPEALGSNEAAWAQNRRAVTVVQ